MKPEKNTLIKTPPSLAKVILAGERVELEVAEDRLWRSSSSKCNTGVPVSERAALGLEAGGGKPVWRDPQGGSEREGGGARAAAEICTAAGRHSVATLSHRLAEPPIERRQQQKRTKKMAIPPLPPWIQ